MHVDMALDTQRLGIQVSVTLGNMMCRCMALDPNLSRFPPFHRFLLAIQSSGRKTVVWSRTLRFSTHHRDGA